MRFNGFIFLVTFFFLSANIANAVTDKYRLVIRDNPSNSIVIGWNQVSGANPVVYYDTIDHGTNFASYTFTHGVDRTVNSKGMDNRFSRLNNLLADKVYYFVIKDDNSTSARFSFRTAPDDSGKRLSIIAGGDSRSNSTPRRNANLLVAKLRAHAVLFGGDMTEFDTNGEWQTWFDDWQLSISPDGRMTAIIPARGNHEYSSTVVHELFDVNSADIYFANTFGGNLFRAYTLNSNIATGGNQSNWLSADLQANANVIWKAAQYHHPMRPHTTSKPERNDIYTDWLPSFEQYGMNIGIECDAHLVKHSYPIKSSSAVAADEGFIRDDLNGIVYIGEGCWGAPLRAADDAKNWTREMGSFNQFHLIYIEINKIEIRCVGVDNASSVGQLDDNTRFTLPTNIDIWQAPTGDVIVIENYRIAGRPDVSLINPLNGQSFTNLNIIPLIAIAADTDGGNVDSVQFFVNGEYVGTSTSGSNNFRFDWTPTQSGLYNVYAKAFDNDGKINRTAGVWITVYTNNTSMEASVVQGSDDAEEYSNGTLNTNSTTLDLVDDSGLGQIGQTLGIRFANLGIPQGATILNAYIQFSSNGISASAVNLNIRMQDDANGLTFIGNGNITARTLLVGSVPWSPPAWNSSGQTGMDQQTPNLASLLQQVVNKSNWAPGNAAVFVIDGSGQRIASSYEAGNAPRLVVVYSLNGNNFPGNLQVQVNNSSDDAEESSLGITNTNSSDLDIVYEFPSNQKIGIRFNDIYIPRGAIIESAYIQFYTADLNSGSTNFSIRIQDDVNPETFDALSVNNISGRPTLPAVVNWSPAGWTILGEADIKQRTPNIAVLLQGIINKNAWNSGNSVAFIITGSGERDAVAYDGNPLQAPVLVVNFKQSFPPISAPQLPDLVLCGNGTISANAGNAYAKYFWNNDLSENQLSTFEINAAGTYSLRVMDAYGQVAVDTFIVSQGAAAIPNLGPDTAFSGSPITLFVTGGTFSSYLWSNGAVSPSITVSSLGSYSVTVTNADGCSGTDQVVVYAPSNIVNVESGSLELFPNPARETVNIKISESIDKEIDMKIIDLSGRVLMQRMLPSGQNQWILDLEGLPSGAYWLQLKHNQRILGTKTLIKL
jgi:hypothetical protein